VNLLLGDCPMRPTAWVWHLMARRCTGTKHPVGGLCAPPSPRLECWLPPPNSIINLPKQRTRLARHRWRRQYLCGGAGGWGDWSGVTCRGITRFLSYWQFRHHQHLLWRCRFAYCLCDVGWIGGAGDDAMAACWSAAGVQVAHKNKLP